MAHAGQAPLVVDVVDARSGDPLPVEGQCGSCCGPSPVPEMAEAPNEASTLWAVHASVVTYSAPPRVTHTALARAMTYAALGSLSSMLQHFVVKQHSLLQ